MDSMHFSWGKVKGFDKELPGQMSLKSNIQGLYIKKQPQN